MSIHEARTQAINLRSELALNEPFIDVEMVTDRLGINLHYEELDDDVSGFLIIENNEPTIIVNAAHHSNRQRFTIAHEIGHYRLHAIKKRKDLFVDKKYNRDANSSKGEIQEEKEANSFAAELLMPKKMLQIEILESGLDAFDDTATYILAKKFGVSEQAIGFRLAKLNLGWNVG